MKRADIRAIFPEATDEQISQFLSAVHSEVDKLRDQNDDLQEKLDKATKDAGKDSNEWQKKYESEHTAFENYKSAQTEKETRGKKQTALAGLLKGSLSERGITMATKYADYKGIELGEDGTIKDASKLLTSMKEEWSDFVTTEEDNGVETKGGAGGAAGGNGGKSMTREEIMKITDAGKRQQAIAEHLDLFQ